MEWQGIDLSHNKQRDWVTTHWQTLKNLFLITLILIGIGLSLLFYHLQKQQEIQPLVSQLNLQQTEYTALENKISHLQNHHKPNSPVAKQQQITQLLNIIEQLPLKNGGLNALQIYFEHSLYLRLSGKLNTQQDFQQLEAYLSKQKPIELKTDQINVNHKNEIHFIFTLKYKGE